MQEEYGFKDFEEVRLKALTSFYIGDREIEEGETIVMFDHIMISGLSDVRSRVSAHGGYLDRSHVFWETLNEQKLNFSQGVFSKDQFALLSNSKMIQAGADETIISKREIIEIDEHGKAQLAEFPVDNKVFLYFIDTGEKQPYYHMDGKEITAGYPYDTYVVDYEYRYNNNATVYKLGQNLFNGFVSLEGKTRIKDDTTGRVVTGIIKIPKLRLMSDMSMRLGAQATPVVANFNAICVPVGSRGDSYVSEFYFLNDDIDSDIY